MSVLAVKPSAVSEFGRLFWRETVSIFVSPRPTPRQRSSDVECAVSLAVARAFVFQDSDLFASVKRFVGRHKVTVRCGKHLVDRNLALVRIGQRRVLHAVAPL